MDWFVSNLYKFCWLVLNCPSFVVQLYKFCWIVKKGRIQVNLYTNKLKTTNSYKFVWHPTFVVHQRISWPTHLQVTTKQSSTRQTQQKKDPSVATLQICYRIYGQFTNNQRNCSMELFNRYLDRYHSSTNIQFIFQMNNKCNCIDKVLIIIF